MKAQLEIPPISHFLEPALQFAHTYAKKLNLPDSKQIPLRDSLEAALLLLMETNALGNSEFPIRIEFDESHGKLVVSILNRGVPVFAAPPESITRRFHEAAQKLERFSIDNLGRNGQQIQLELALLSPEKEDVQPIHRTSLLTDQEIVIRTLKTEEAHLLSELFYFVYGYSYINEFVYYPEQIRSKIETESLISTVAVTADGKIVGHVGLLKINQSPPVFEACLGVVHPDVKSRGVFGQLFRATMDQVKATPMQYCFFDFVTNHDLTQRFVSQFNPCDMALMVGCQSKKTQAKLEKLGIGHDPSNTNRYSILYSLIPRTDYPFGREVFLPEILGDKLGFILDSINVSWCPTPRFDPMPIEGDYSVEYQPAQESVVFDFFKPGKKATDKLIHTWENLLKSGYQYAGVNIPLEQEGVPTPGLSSLFNTLSKHHFFVSGFLPYRNSNRLALRLQTMGPTKVDFDEIKVFSDHSKRLLQIIREEHPL